jgi:hypothetical protein
MGKRCGHDAIDLEAARKVDTNGDQIGGRVYGFEIDKILERGQSETR